MTILPAHDMPDDYDWLPGSARFPLADLGELAARLGSPVIFDRRGEVLWYDMCNKGLGPFIIGGGGLGYQVYVDSQYSLHGNYCVNLIGGSTASFNATLFKSMTAEAMLHCGYEVAFAFLTLCSAYSIIIYYNTGTQVLTAVIRIDYVANTLSYYGSDGAYHAFASVGILHSLWGVYHFLKMVVNFEIGHYVRCIFDDIEYDLSAYAVKTAPQIGLAYYYIGTVFTSRNANNDRALIGHMIITGNEG